MIRLAAMLLLCAACGGNPESGSNVNAQGLLIARCGSDPCPGASLIEVSTGLAAWNVECHCGTGELTASVAVLDGAGCSDLQNAWAGGGCH